MAKKLHIRNAGSTLVPLDDIPTEGSNNTVKSGGVFEMLSQVPTLTDFETVIESKVEKDGNKVLSDNNFTNTDKQNLLELLGRAFFSGSFDDLTNIPNFIQEARRAVANGVASLDATGRVPMSQLNVSGLQFKGAWNPNTNIPAIIDGTGTVGDFYKASHTGTFNSGNGTFTYSIGDWVIYAGGIWQRLGSADTVSMVNGKLGNVVLTAADVGALPSTYVPPIAAVQSVNNKTGNVDITVSDISGLQTAIDGKMAVPSTTFSVPIRGSSENGGHLPYSVSAVANSFPVRGANGTFSIGEPTLSTHPVTKNYVDGLTNVIKTVVAGWTVWEYSDRIEYKRKITTSISIPATGYQTVNTNILLPTGITSFVNADEFYVNIVNPNRDTALTVTSNTSRQIILAGHNVYTSVANPTVDIFIKLIKYK